MHQNKDLTLLHEQCIYAVNPKNTSKDIYKTKLWNLIKSINQVARFKTESSWLVPNQWRFTLSINSNHHSQLIFFQLPLQQIHSYNDLKSGQTTNLILKQFHFLQLVVHWLCHCFQPSERSQLPAIEAMTKMSFWNILHIVELYSKSYAYKHFRN